MNKEDLIRLIESIDFEYCTNLVLTYCCKKPNSSYYVSENDKVEMIPKTITFEKDLETLINEKYSWTNEKIEKIYKDVDYLQNEIIKLKGERK